MQAQKIAPIEFICKDKFLVQSTAVPEGTTDKDITSSMFSKDDNKYVEEKKLRVIVVSPPHSPLLSPVNEEHKKILVREVPVLKDELFDSVGIISPQKKKKSIGSISLLKSDIAEDITPQKNKTAKDINPQKNKIVQDVSSLTNKNCKDISIQKMDTDEAITQLKENNTKNVILQSKVAVDEMESKMESCDELVPAKSAEPERMRDVEDVELVKASQNMKLKLNELESKLREAEITISKLTAERRLNSADRETLRKEVVNLKSGNGMRKVQVGFPFRFVVLVALVSIILGYLLRC